MNWIGKGRKTEYFKTADFNKVDDYADGLHTVVMETAAARRCMHRIIFSYTCGIFF
jgi:hypothetical protein